MPDHFRVPAVCRELGGPHALPRHSLTLFPHRKEVSKLFIKNGLYGQGMARLTPKINMNNCLSTSPENGDLIQTVPLHSKLSFVVKIYSHKKTLSTFFLDHKI